MDKKYITFYDKFIRHSKTVSDCRVDKDVLFFRPTLEEQTYISDYLQKKYSALDGALGS